MFDINKIYEKEKVINKKFKERYDYNDPVIFYKQVLELICELSELSYETKCFKYWKNDKPSDVSITLAEYADCLMITLCFCDLANLQINTLPKVKETDIVQQFVKLNNLASQITINNNGKLLLKILSNLINLSKLLGYTDKEIEEFCEIKMNKTLAMVCDN